MRRAGLVLAVLALLAACGTADAGGPGPGGAALLGEWELSAGSIADAPLAMPTVATLVVTQDRVRGRAFCNSYDAGYDLDGDSFAVADVALTEVGCEPEVMAAEQAFVAALTSVRRADILDGSLMLSGADVQLRFARPPAVPDRELTGTRWVLDTLVDGDTASSTVMGTEADLVLASDGTLTGSTGCRDLTGTWVDDGALRFTGLPTGGCSGPAAGQDAAVLAVLAGPVDARVEGQTLRLTTDDGRGLGYRAG